MTYRLPTIATTVALQKLMQRSLLLSMIHC
jgi:hypothetical protein